nr:hypothetical protein [Blastocatellia bacterium]
VITNLNPSGGDIIRDIALQPDGKILGVFSTNTVGVLLGMSVVRYNANGSLDLGFGTGGGFVSTTTQANESSAAIALSGNKIVAAGDGADIGVARFNLTASPSQSNDFDGDGFSDYVIFRPSTANWFVLRSSDQSVQILLFGANGDVPLNGDFDGDGKSDLAIYRPSVGEWWFMRSSSGTVLVTQFGQAGDKPVPGDVDKDGKTDLVHWRPTNGNWLVIRSSDGFSSFFSFPFGQNGDVPVGTAIFP